MTASAADQRRAWGWTAALRDGATTPWREWAGEADPSGSTLPGAQQLALLRRLNEQARSLGRTVPDTTATRVLAAGVSGRGRSDLPVLGVDDEQFGARPVDPDDLAADELLRVATALIADDVALVGALPVEPRSLVERVRELRRPWVRSFVVVGMPWRADAIRAQLAAQGHRQGGRRPTAYLLADDLGTVLAHAWTARSFDQGGVSWRAFVRSCADGGHLPPRADLARMARSAAAKYGAEQVRVVLDPGALEADLGVKRLPGPPRLGADAIDLVRRVGEPLGLLVPHEERPGLLRRTLGERLDGLGGPLPTVPVRWEAWLSSQAERMRHDLLAADYRVLGDLDSLLTPPLGPESVQPVDARVLALALGLLLDPVTAPVEEQR